MTNEEAIAYGKRVIDLGLNDETQAFCKLAIKALETIPKYKDAYNKGWADGAKASYEHLKMCEEEQGGDLISKQDAIDAVKTRITYAKAIDCNGNEYNLFESENSELEKAIRNIEALPSVNPQEPKWIPVSERLPEHYQNILFSTKTDRVFEGRYFKDETEHQWYSFRDECFAWNNVITAWMPLPKPYRAKMRTKNDK